MDYGDLLRRAWRIVWENKFLFLIGFLAALGAGTNGNSVNYSVGSEDVGFMRAEAFQIFLDRYLGLALAAGCLVVIIAILLWLLRLSAQAGLIDAAARLDQGEHVTFGQAMSAGLNRLGRMVGISLLLYGPLLIVGAIFGLLALAALFAYVTPVSVQSQPSDTGPWALLAILGICAFPLLCILALYWLIATLVYPFAQRGAVLADLGAADSIRHGWRVLRDNLGPVLILAILFIFISFVFGLVGAAVVIPVAIAAFLPLVNAIEIGRLGASEVILAGAAVLFLMLVVGVIQSIVVTWRSTAFTLAYQQFVKGVVPSAAS